MVEDRDAAVIVIFARFVECIRLSRKRVDDLVDFKITNLGDVWRNGRSLPRNEQLCAGGIDEFLAGNRCSDLLFGEVAAVVVSDHVIQRIAFDRAAAIVPAIGVAVRNHEVAMGVHFRHGTVVLPDSRIGWIDEARRVAVGHIENVRAVGNPGPPR